MFCKKCGVELVGENAFCPHCGEKVTVENTNANVIPSPEHKNEIEQPCLQESNKYQTSTNAYHPQMTENLSNPYPATDTNKSKEKKSGSHKKAVVGIVSGVTATAVVVAGGIITYNVLNSPANQAVHLINDQKYDEAFAMYESSDKDPSIVNKITDSLVESLNSIKRDFTNKEITYDDAKNQLLEIQQFNFSDVQSLISEVSLYIERMQTSFTAYSNGIEALSQEKYSDAIWHLQGVIAEDPDYETAIDSLYEAIDKYIEQTLSETEKLASSKDYASALTKLNTAINQVKPLSKNDEHKALEDKYNEYKTEFISEIIEQAQNEKSNQNYDKAVSIIQEAMNIVSDESLDAELVAIEEERPRKLEELKISESDNYIQITDLIETNDVVGNTYSPNNLFQISANADGWGSGYEGYADYFLNYKYKRLTGTIAVADSSATTNATLTIYGDKDIIWTSGTLNRTTPPKELDIDLSNVDWLEIKLTTDEEAPDGTLSVLLSNFQFTK